MPQYQVHFLAEQALRVLDRQGTLGQCVALIGRLRPSIPALFLLADWAALCHPEA